MNYKKTLCIILCNGLLFFVLFEISSRTFLRFKRGTDFLDPSKTYLFYYPEAKKLEESTNDSDFHDILLLGASVLNPAWGSIEKSLEAKLKRQKKDQVRIFNLGMPAHTSRDSLIKYSLLRKRPFDKVFVYHGINDIRINNYKADFYKEDYSHIQWYRTVNPLLSHTELEYLATPFMLSHIYSKLFNNTIEDDYENIAFGNNSRVGLSFRKNIESIIEIAKLKGDEIILSTYAFHIPDDYSKEKFLKRNLDYDKHRLEIEVWGEVPNVRKNVLNHNSIIKDLSKKHGIKFVDMFLEIEGNKTNFDDICHLTESGSFKFSEVIEDYIFP